nr:GntR family transcriptional regulator [Pseudomonas sp.]
MSTPRTSPVNQTWSPNPGASTLSLPEQIAEKIGNEIIDGEREPGSRISETDIASRFTVSRSPVREALRILEREGLVQINARRGAQVTALSLDEVQHIFDPRIVLNGLLARRVAERRDEQFAERFSSWVQALPETAENGDTASYVDAVFATHRLLASGCDNPFLVQLVFSLAHQTVRYTRLGLSTKARRQESARKWCELSQAIQNQDGDKAESLVRKLVQESRDMALKKLSK